MEPQGVRRVVVTRRTRRRGQDGWLLSSALLMKRSGLSEKRPLICSSLSCWDRVRRTELRESVGRTGGTAGYCLFERNACNVVDEKLLGPNQRERFWRCAKAGPPRALQSSGLRGQEG